MLTRLLKRITNLQADELPAAMLSWACFFFIFSGYYILRPLREEMGLAGGVGNLPWLFMATLVAMLLATPLFGALVNRFPRRTFVSVTYRFFMVNLLIFFGLLHLLPAAADVTIGRVFYVWVSVFNLFAVSLFWAFMADGFDYLRSKRVFGFIAMGGSLGAIVGAALTAALVGSVGRLNLILLAVVLLEIAVRCFHGLGRMFATIGIAAVKDEETLLPVNVDAATQTADPPLTSASATAPPARASELQTGAGILGGIVATLRSPYLLAISAYLFLYSLSSTFLYFEQANIVAAAVVDRTARAALFARIDLWVNVLTLVTQIAFTGRIIPRLGVGLTLAMLPLLTAAGFASLALAPVLTALVIFQVTRRATNYALVKPARETLYTIVPLPIKYKAKSFIDTFVYRGGDALGAGLFGLLTRAGWGLSAIAWLAVPCAVVWGAVGIFLGARQRRYAREQGFEKSVKKSIGHHAA